MSDNDTFSAERLCIITVAYNNSEEMKKTLFSLESQCTQPDSHIVVAAGFPEWEKEKIERRFAAHFRSFIFDMDDSLYDAMNIGLSNSVGDAVLFLNAGDTLHSSDAIKHIKQTFVLGQCLQSTTLQEYDGEYYRRVPIVKGNKITQTPGHQGFVAPLPIAKNFFFEHKKNPISADVRWMEALHHYCGSVTSKKIIAIFQLGGLSNRPTIKSLSLRFKDGGLPSLTKELLRFAIFMTLGPRLAYRLLYFKKYDRLDRNRA